MTEVWDRLFIGGIDDALEIAELNPFGITTVITLCREPIRIRRGGVNYLNFPVVEAQANATRSTRCDPGCPLGEHPVGAGCWWPMGMA